MPALEMSTNEFRGAVETYLAQCDAEVLRQVLRQLAEELPPSERAAFLARLAIAPAAPAPRPEHLLSEIQEFVREFSGRVAEGGMEDEYDRGSYYDDEDAVGPYEDDVPQVQALLDRIGDVFDRGDLALAAAAYQELFDLFGQQDDYGRGITLDDLDAKTAQRAVACRFRALLETTPPAARCAELWAAFRGAFVTYAGSPDVGLRDVLGARAEPLADQEQFLGEWIAWVRTQDGPLADGLLREATRLRGGADALAQLAAAEGDRRPLAYLDWLQALAAAGRDRDLTVAACRALQKLPARSEVRALVSEEFAAAATRLADADLVALARWEAYAAGPTLVRLLELGKGQPAERRAAILREAAAVAAAPLAPPPPGDSQQDRRLLLQPVAADLPVHAWLLAGDWQAACAFCRGRRTLPQGYGVGAEELLVGAILAGAVAAAKPAPKNVAAIWQRACTEGHWSYAPDFSAADEEDTDDLADNSPAVAKSPPATPGRQPLVARYAEILADSGVQSQARALVPWAVDQASQLAAAIVSAKRRHEYGHAAVLIAAGAEALRHCGQTREAEALIADIRAQFKRHYAFQAELRQVLGERR